MIRRSIRSGVSYDQMDDAHTIELDARCPPIHGRRPVVYVDLTATGQHRQVVQFRLVDRRGDRSDAVPGQRRRRSRFRHRRRRRRPGLHLSLGAAQLHRQRLGGCDDLVQLRRAEGHAQRLPGRHRDQRQLDGCRPAAAEPEVFLRKRKHPLVRYHQSVVAADRAGPGADLRESPEPGVQRLCPGVYQDAGQL